LLYVLIIMFGQTSGAHFNPAVSLVMMMRRALPPGLGIFYILAQIAGGGAGTLLAHAMFDMPVVQLGIKMRTGTAQHLSEAIATAGLVLTILLVQRADASRVPVAVASYITAGYWFTASTCFANPAVTLARALTDSFAGIRPIDVPGFIGAQLAGALAGLAIAIFFARSENPIK
jgi:glycerol uptake facilitator-like aquaporin